MARVDFKQANVTRAAKAAEAAGLTVARIEVEPNGKVVIVTASHRGQVEPTSSNSWDEVLIQ